MDETLKKSQSNEDESLKSIVSENLDKLDTTVNQQIEKIRLICSRANIILLNLSCERAAFDNKRNGIKYNFSGDLEKNLLRIVLQYQKLVELAEKKDSATKSNFESYKISMEQKLKWFSNQLRKYCVLEDSLKKIFCDMPSEDFDFETSDESERSNESV